MFWKMNSAICCGLATLACAFAIAMCGKAIAADASSDRPNIIFLFADDQCCYSMGCYGNEDAQTPNLDQLASEGIIFDNHYDTTAICMASRANVMTGLYEYRTGCNFEHGPLLNSLWQQSYPMRLRDSGYVTGFAGKFGFEVIDSVGAKKARLPEDDFDQWGGGPGQTSYVTAKNESMAEYADEYPHSTLSYGAFGRDFIESATSADQPFCLSISFKAPHMPATPDPRFNDRYAGARFKKPLNFGRENGSHFSLQSRQGRQYERFHSWHYADAYDKTMRIYHQQVYAIDVAVGMIRQALREQKVDQNTVIIYTSDNGFLCGSHGYGSKVLPYEESSRVPLIMFDPRRSNSGKQLRCQALTANIDFSPTICELAGLSADSTWDGASLMKLYEDPSNSIHESISLINVWGTPAAHSLAVTTDQWKYIYWPHEDKQMQATLELFNTRDDPLEMHNLIDDPSSQSAQAMMRDLYADALAKWKRDSVGHHDYEKYGTIFDPNVSWDQKQTLIRKRK